MKRIEELVRPLTKPIRIPHGITGFSDWKFYLAFLLYSASFVTFVRDPFFHLEGEVVFQQGMIPLLLGVILLNTMYWDFLLFGKPNGANLMLQVSSFFPGGLLFARLLGKASQPKQVSLAKDLWQELTDTTNKIISLPDLNVPSWITDMFYNWKITIALIVLLVVLSLNFHKAFKIGAVYLFFLVSLLTEIASKEASGLFYLLIGTILFVFGLGLQFCRYDHVVYFERINDSLQQDAYIDKFLLRCIMRIMGRLYQNSQLSEKDVREIVSDVYKTAKMPENEYNDMQINQISAEVSRKMIHSFNLVIIQQSSNGAYMYPNRRLFIYNSILRGIAVWPRVLAVLLFAITWVVIPIDIIPDAIPFIGSIDDVFAGLAATLMISDTIRQETNTTY